MKLKLKRYQKKLGMISKEVAFCLEATTILSAEEHFAVTEFKLGKHVIYNSQASRKHNDRGRAALDGGEVLRGVASFAMARLSLYITIDSLRQGQTIECKDLGEVLAAEEAIKEACEALMQYIAVATSFNGKEEVLEF